MKVNSSDRLRVGLGTLWNTLFPIAMLASSYFLDVVSTRPEFMPEAVWSLIYDIRPVVMLFLFIVQIVIWFALVAFYLQHIFYNEVASDEARIYFAIGIVVWGIVVMPIYYFKYIWPEKSVE